MADFQVAGGLILLVLAIRELVASGPHRSRRWRRIRRSPAGYAAHRGAGPVNVPPILIDSVGILYTVISLLRNLLIVAVAFCNADFFSRLAGKQGLRGVSKLIALLLAAIAISFSGSGAATNALRSTSTRARSSHQNRDATPEEIDVVRINPARRVRRFAVEDGVAWKFSQINISE